MGCKSLCEKPHEIFEEIERPPQNTGAYPESLIRSIESDVLSKYNKDKKLSSVTSESKNKQTFSSVKEEPINENTKDLQPKDEFSRYIFQNINKIRTNPQSFIQIIENSKANIQTDKNNRLIYKSGVKVSLDKGKEAFNEAVSILSNTKPMEPLIYEPKMTVELPENEELVKDKNYMKTKVLIMNDNGAEISSFWRDIIKEQETSFILMIVDDNAKKAGLKRKDILNPNYKYIGISSIMIGKSFACYLTFK